MKCEYLQTCQLGLNHPDKCQAEYEQCTIRDRLQKLDEWNRGDKELIEKMHDLEKKTWQR
jgi:hypothetical protein